MSKYYRVRYSYPATEFDFIDVEAEDVGHAEDVAYENIFDAEIYDVEEI